MKRLLLLPYLLTSLVVYTEYVLWTFLANESMVRTTGGTNSTHWLFPIYHFLSDMIYHAHLTNAWWYAISILALVVALTSKE